MEQNRNVARQLLILRWLLLGVAVLMLAGAVPARTLATGAAAVALYNLALMLTARSKRFALLNIGLASFAWVFDAMALSLAVSVSLWSVPSLYFLYVLIIMEAGYVSLSSRKIAATTLGCLAGNLAATLLARSGHDAGVSSRLLVTHSGTMLIAAAMASTINIFKQRDDDMQRRERKLSSLLDFGTRFTNTEDVGRLMEQTLRVAIKDTGATAGYIMLMNPKNDALEMEAAFSVGENYAFPDKRVCGEGVEGYVLQTGKPLLLSREKGLRRVGDPAVPPNLLFDGETVLCVPLVENGANGGANSAGGSRIIGTFSLFNHHPGGRFLPDDMDLVRTVAGLTTMGIVNSQLYQEQREAFVRALQVLARTLDAKDPYTQGHSYRVSELCVLLARQLRIAPEMMDELRNGALLHDIGKIGIPDAVLSKPSRLTDDEFEQMKQHPVIGFEICRPLGLSEGVLMLIRNHHEKLDGTGYPDGLRLGELPLLLRIICVADAFDAMSSSRPYRKTMDSQVRNEQLNRFAGTQFDPVIVESLKNLLRNGDLDELYKDQWTAHDAAPGGEQVFLKAA